MGRQQPSSTRAARADGAPQWAQPRPPRAHPRARQAAPEAQGWAVLPAGEAGINHPSRTFGLCPLLNVQLSCGILTWGASKEMGTPIPQGKGLLLRDKDRRGLCQDLNPLWPLRHHTTRDLSQSKTLLVLCVESASLITTIHDYSRFALRTDVPWACVSECV